MEHLFHPWHYAPLLAAIPLLPMLVPWIRRKAEMGELYRWPWLPITYLVGCLVVGREITHREYLESRPK